MKYYKVGKLDGKAMIYRTYYFALKDSSWNNVKALQKDLGWDFFPREMVRISALEYAFRMLIHPVTNHKDCMNYTKAVVIE